MQIIATIEKTSLHPTLVVRIRNRYGTHGSGSAKGAHHTSPARRAGYSDGRGQSAESAFHFNPRQKRSWNSVVCLGNDSRYSSWKLR